jgi:hypothetical protein
MKKLPLLLIFAGSLLMMAGCETTREITFKNETSGILQSTMDMSSLIGIAKMAGKDKDMDKMGDKAIDTVIMLDKIADSIADISAEDRALVKKGKLNMLMNMKDEKFVIKLEFPFSDPAEIGRLDKLSSKMVTQALKKQLADGAGADAGMPKDGMPEGSMDDYFTTTYSKGLIQKKLNKEKYATVGSDEAMNTLKQVSSMGAGNNTIIINLPKPAKKAEGKNVKLSDDKKKVTITTSTEDFFDDGASLEFSIEY